MADVVRPKPGAWIRAPRVGVATAYTGLSYDRIIEEKAADLSGYGLQTPAVELTDDRQRRQNPKASDRR